MFATRNILTKWNDLNASERAGHGRQESTSHNPRVINNYKFIMKLKKIKLRDASGIYKLLYIYNLLRFQIHTVIHCFWLCLNVSLKFSNKNMEILENPAWQLIKPILNYLKKFTARILMSSVSSLRTGSTVTTRFFRRSSSCSSSSVLYSSMVSPLAKWMVLRGIFTFFRFRSTISTVSKWVSSPPEL